MAMRTVRGMLALAVGTALAIVAPSAAFAGAVHDGGHEHAGSEVFGGTVPCHPELGFYRITTTYNAVFHVTQNANGESFTETETGSFVAVPTEVLRDANGDPIVDEDGNLTPVGDPLPGETFSGHFTSWDGGNFTEHGTVFTATFSVRGTGSEGTTFAEHDLFHFTGGPGDPQEDPNVPVKVAFSKQHCA
jgi:hypothetical protein